MKAYIREVAKNEPGDDGYSTDASSTVDSVFDPPPGPMVSGGRRYSTDGDDDSDDFASGDDSEIRPRYGSVILSSELLLLDRPFIPSVRQTKQSYTSTSPESSVCSPLAMSTIPKPRLVTLAPDEFGIPIPDDAKWTKITRRLVSPEVLEQDQRRYEA